MISARIADQRFRRLERSKWFKLVPLLVTGVWVVLLLAYFNITKPDEDKSSGSNFEIIRRVSIIRNNTASSVLVKRMGQVQVSASSNDESALFSREPDVKPDYDPTTLKVMTWNILGMNLTKVEERAGHVVKTVLRERVDAVLFQEMAPEYYKIVCKSLRKQYGCLRSTYNLTTLFKKSRFDFESHQALPFSAKSTHVLLIVELSLKSSRNPQIALFNSHLTAFPIANRSILRKEQFNQCIKYGNYPENFNVIFGGDTNLEDEEESDIDVGDFKDLWKECGSSENIRYTWDSTKNHMDLDCLVKIPNQKPRTRYDRFYFRSSTPKTLQPINLTLSGTEKVEGTDLFVSDHWALISTFKVLEANDTDSQYSCKVS